MTRMHADHHVSRLKFARGAVLLTALLAMLFTSQVCAADDASIYAKLPLANRFRNRCWTPMTAVVGNRTTKDADMTARFVLKVGTSDTEKVSFSRTVWVPAGGTRDVDLSAFFDMTPDELNEAFEKRKKNTASYEDTTYADGVTVRRNKAPMPEAVMMDIELYANGFLAAKPEPFYIMPLHPNAINQLSVEGASFADAPHGALNVVDGVECIRGEVEDGFPASVADMRSVTNANLPPDGMLGGRVVSSGTIGSIEYLPRTWAAYQGIDALMLGAAAGYNGELDAMQRTSLLDWVVSGGRLIITPGGRVEDFQHPYFDKLLPVRLVRERRVGSLAALEARYGGTISLTQDTEVTYVEALAGVGEVLARDGDHVLLARRQVGRGSVWFSAFKGEQLERWRQGLKLTSEMMWPDADPVPGLRDALPEAAMPIMQTVVGVVAPSRMVVICILGGYAVACVILLLLLRLRGKTELAWPIAMVLSVAGLCGAVGYGMSVRAQTGFVQGEIGVSVMGNLQGKASSLGYVSVFAGESSIEADARFSNPDTLATASAVGKTGGGRSMSVSNLNVDQADRFYLRNLVIKGGELFTCNTMTLTDYAQGIEMHFGYDAKGYAGTIVNRTGVDLVDCVLMVNRRLLRIGALANGQTVDIAKLVPVAAEEVLTRLSSDVYMTDEESKTRARMLGVLRRIPNVGGGLSDRTWDWPPTFYGWAKRPLAYVTFGDEADPVQRSLQLLALPAERIEGPIGETIRIPSGSCGLKFSGTRGRNLYGVPAKAFSPRRGGAQNTAGGPKGASSSRAHGMQKSEYTLPPMGVSEKPGPEDDFVPPAWLPVRGFAERFQIGFLRPLGLEKMKVTKGSLLFSLHGSGFDAVVSIRKGDMTSSGGWTALKQNGSSRIEIPDIARYVGAKGELPQFQLEIKLPTDAQPGLSGIRWQIQAFDLELEGILPKTGAERSLPPFDVASMGG